MTQSPDPGLTEEQFRQICSYLLIYAYVLLLLQVAGATLLLISATRDKADNGLLFLTLAALIYSFFIGRSRIRFFHRKTVNNGIYGAVGIGLPLNQNVTFWSGWCFLELFGAAAVLYQSAKALFGTE